MPETVNERLLTIIQEISFQEKSIHNILMDLLSLSKESVYRRLRNEIPFTFDEVVKIATRFGFSIDEIVDSGKIMSKWAILNVDNLYSSDNYIMQYCDKCISYLNILGELRSAKKSILRLACNMIPYPFLLPYKKLNQFWHYKWSFLMKRANPEFLFSNMILPDKLIQIEKQFFDASRQLPRTVLILDKDIFTYLVNDIRFFISKKLISRNELEELKKELLEFISHLEAMVETGHYESGMEISIYLSNINLDGSYYHAEYDGKEFGLQRCFYVDRLCFNNTKFCNKQKEWIELLKRFSTLLTQSGDKIRFDFFKNQRRLVNSLEYDDFNSYPGLLFK